MRPVIVGCSIVVSAASYGQVTVNYTPTTARFPDFAPTVTVTESPAGSGNYT